MFWAAPNMGKTHIQKRFMELYATRTGNGEVASNAVLWMELNDSLTEKRLYLDILNTMNAPTPDTTAPRLQAMRLAAFAIRDSSVCGPGQRQGIYSYRSNQ